MYIICLSCWMCAMMDVALACPLSLRRRSCFFLPMHTVHDLEPSPHAKAALPRPPTLTQIMTSHFMEEALFISEANPVNSIAEICL